MNVLYILLPLVFLGLVVFFIVKHFKNICTPKCDNKICGPNGCGGNCGTCPDGKSCSPDGTSCSCEPTCNGLHCGPDTCGGGGLDKCGTCLAGKSCDSTGKCVDCAKNCDNKVCGSDGCGGECGNCIYQCSPDQKSCICVSDCTGKICGPDNCNVANACGDCSQGTVCALDGKSCTNPPEIYYYNPNTGGEYTKINAQTYVDTDGNVPVATYQEVLDEYKVDYGLDSCYLGWTDSSFDLGSDLLEMVNPYRTQIPGSTFCSKPNTNNISKNPSTSRPYEDDTQSAGLYLYGVKPNLPDCNNSNPNISGNPCVGRYNKDKMSKYDP